MRRRACRVGWELVGATTSLKILGACEEALEIVVRGDYRVEK